MVLDIRARQSHSFKRVHAPAALGLVLIRIIIILKCFDNLVSFSSSSLAPDSLHHLDEKSSRIRGDSTQARTRDESYLQYLNFLAGRSWPRKGGGRPYPNSNSCAFQCFTERYFLECFFMHYTHFCKES